MADMRSERAAAPVDGAPRQDYPRYLDQLAGMSETGRRKRYRHLQLQPGQRVLDAGCGLGEVARALAELVRPDGLAIGVDLNPEHLALAQARAGTDRGVDYRRADLTALPFEDASFDAIYSERVFQHLSRPDKAMEELFRVLRPGGRIVVADADHLATVVDADDVDVAEQVQTASARLGSVNPAAGRGLRSYMVMAGFVEIAVEPETLVITDRTVWKTVEPSQVEDVLAALIEKGDVTQERAEAHLSDLTRRQDEHRFLAALPGYNVSGARPPTIEAQRSSGPRRLA